MGKLFSFSILSLFIGNIIFPILSLSAATPVAQLEIVAPTSARVGEAIDITVRAIDKDKKVVTSYRGSVIFNTDNIGDTVPMPGKTVAFSADDNGEKKFSKGLIFKKTGKQKIYVSDVSDDILGEATITVEAASVSTSESTESVTIITPETNTKITSDTVLVSGKTRKNSRVLIRLNGKDVGTTNTDDSGIFTKTLSDINQDNNILTASLIDGSNASIATSSEVNFSHMVTSSATYGVSISPSATVEASSPVEITIDATPALTELSISLDGAILVATEQSSGKYVIKTVAPQKAGTYKFPITQKDAIGQTKTFDTTTSLIVTEKTSLPARFKNIKTTTSGKRIQFEFFVENPPSDLSTFKIAYGKNADALSEESITMTLDKIKSSTNTGAYAWYIDTIAPDTYTFKIFGRTLSGTLITDFVSEPIVATIGTVGCTIGNVGDITVQSDTSKSVMSWEPLSGALSYNIYKVSPSGEYTLFQNTIESSYTLFLSKGTVAYDNFVVKALCDTNTESKEYSRMSKVQTGPGMIAFIVIVSAILGAFVMRRRSI